MLQHLLAIIIFVLCLSFAVCRIVRIARQARNKPPQCITCSKTHCALHHAHESSQCTKKDARTTQK